jgi:hypothetical protein
MLKPQLKVAYLNNSNFSMTAVLMVHTELSSLVASSTMSLLGACFFLRIAVAKSSLHKELKTLKLIGYSFFAAEAAVSFALSPDISFIGKLEKLLRHESWHQKPESGQF